ncbi:DNA primase [Aquabacter spiritensis]|nr:DNA primase [Aquabacter spiritensis]
MRFPPSFLDEIRARLPVSDVVGRRVKLRKQGREFAGLSPFNPEKTPSFFVNDQKGFYHCFSSGKHGDVFDFLMETEGLPFGEAVERLAAMAGLPLPEVTPEARVREARRRTLHDVLDLAAAHFEAGLQARAGAKARGYLSDRGLGAPAQTRFRIGYAAAERFGLKEALGKAGVGVADMVEAGLLVAGDDIPVPYDRFRDRVMFPITDLKGRVVGFGGRALEKDAQAKYLNSPETPLFHKGGLLYNGFSARAAVHSGARLIAVEGYMDVIAMAGAGFEGAVAPLGTALTEDQLQLLWRMADEPVLLFDGDKAGRRAAFRAIDVALPHLKPGKSLAFGTLPDGQDPDDLIRRSGREAMEAVLARTEPLAAMLWVRETEGASLETPERRAALEARIADIVAMIGDESVRRHYRQDLAERFKRLLAPAASGAWSAARRPQGRGRGPAPPPPLAPRGGDIGRSSAVRGSASSLPRNEALLLFCLINHPWLLEESGEEIAALPFENAEAAGLCRTLVEAHLDGEIGGEVGAEAVVLPEAVEDIRRRVAVLANPRMDWPAYPDTNAQDVRLWWRQRAALHLKAYTLSRELREAERHMGDDPSEANFAWLRDVRERLSAIEGTEALVEGFGAASGRSSARSL